MTHVSDAKHATLLTRLGKVSGHVSDLEKEWLAGQGAESFEDLALQLGFDSVSSWLTSLGHTGAIADQWYQYWTAPPPPMDSMLVTRYGSAYGGIKSQGTLTTDESIDWILSIGPNFVGAKAPHTTKYLVLTVEGDTYNLLWSPLFNLYLKQAADVGTDIQAQEGNVISFGVEWKDAI